MSTNTQVITEEDMPPFRLLDLPSEIRNKVYRDVLANEGVEKYVLATFKLPAIVRASKQLRSESLPLFFSETHFSVLSLSNFEGREEYRQWLKLDLNGFLPPQRDSVVKECGTLGLKKVAKTTIRKAGSDILIRHLTIKVADPDDVQLRMARKRSEKWSNKFSMYYIELNWDHGRMKVSTAPGKLYPPREAYFYTKRDVKDTIHEAEDEAKNIAGRDGFKGFSLHDVEKIAKKLRYVYPTN